MQDAPFSKKKGKMPPHPPKESLQYEPEINLGVYIFSLSIIFNKSNRNLVVLRIIVLYYANTYT
jgi:hypothetical protein